MANDRFAARLGSSPAFRSRPRSTIHNSYSLLLECKDSKRTVVCSLTGSTHYCADDRS